MPARRKAAVTTAASAAPPVANSTFSATWASRDRSITRRSCRRETEFDARVAQGCGGGPANGNPPAARLGRGEAHAWRQRQPAAVESRQRHGQRLVAPATGHAAPGTGRARTRRRRGRPGSSASRLRGRQRGWGGSEEPLWCVELGHALQPPERDPKQPDQRGRAAEGHCRRARGRPDSTRRCASQHQGDTTMSHDEVRVRARWVSMRRRIARSRVDAARAPKVPEQLCEEIAGQDQRNDDPVGGRVGEPSAKPRNAAAMADGPAGRRPGPRPRGGSDRGERDGGEIACSRPAAAAITSRSISVHAATASTRAIAARLAAVEPYTAAHHQPRPAAPRGQRAT